MLEGVKPVEGWLTAPPAALGCFMQRRSNYPPAPRRGYGSITKTRARLRVVYKHPCPYVFNSTPKSPQSPIWDIISPLLCTHCGHNPKICIQFSRHARAGQPFLVSRMFTARGNGRVGRGRVWGGEKVRSLRVRASNIRTHPAPPRLHCPFPTTPPCYRLPE